MAQKRRATGEAWVQVGFKYADAVAQLSLRYPRASIAEYCGVSVRTISNWKKDSIPSHPEGERLWTLYVRTFNRKPPLTLEQLGTPEEDSKVGKLTSIK